MSPFDILANSPLDLQIEILQHLRDLRCLVRCAQVSRIWRAILYSPDLSTLYRRIFQSHFPNIAESLPWREKANDLENKGSLYSYRTLQVLLKNKLGFETGGLSRTSSIPVPDYLGLSQIFYTDGYLALYSDTEMILPVGDKNVILLYDLALWKVDKEVVCHEIRCPRRYVLAVTIGNGKLVYASIAGRETETPLYITMIDLSTITVIREYRAAHLHHLGESPYLSAPLQPEDGHDAFQSYKSQLNPPMVVRLHQSPVHLVTNGRLIALSASFLTQCTIWDTTASSDSPLAGHTIIPSAFWTSHFMSDAINIRKCQDKNPAGLAYFMTLTPQDELLITVNGQLASTGCSESPYENEWFFFRSVCKAEDGEYLTIGVAPAPEQAQVSHAEYSLPPRRMEMETPAPDVYVAKKISSFTIGGEVVHWYEPPDPNFEDGFRDAATHFKYDNALTFLYSRLLTERRLAGTHCGSGPSDAQEHETYTLDYANRDLIWPIPLDRSTRSRGTERELKIVPGGRVPLPHGETPVMYMFFTFPRILYHPVTGRPTYGADGVLNIIGARSFAGINEMPCDDIFGLPTRRYVGRINADTREPTVNEEVNLGLRNLRANDYAGDDQWIVVLHAVTTDDTILVEGSASVVSLFRYGDVGKVDLNIRKGKLLQ